MTEKNFTSHIEYQLLGQPHLFLEVDDSKRDRYEDTCIACGYVASAVIRYTIVGRRLCKVGHVAAS
jgi:hypothetical protein